MSQFIKEFLTIKAPKDLWTPDIKFPSLSQYEKYYRDQITLTETGSKKRINRKKNEMYLKSVIEGSYFYGHMFRVQSAITDLNLDSAVNEIFNLYKMISNRDAALISFVWKHFLQKLWDIFSLYLQSISEALKQNNLQMALDRLSNTISMFEAKGESFQIQSFPFLIIFQRFQKVLQMFLMIPNVAIKDCNSYFADFPSGFISFLIEFQDILPTVKINGEMISVQQTILPKITEAQIMESKIAKSYPLFPKVLGIVFRADMDLIATQTQIPRAKILDAYIAKDSIFDNFEIHGNEIKLKIGADLEPLLQDLDKQFKHWDQSEEKKL